MAADDKPRMSVVSDEQISVSRKIPSSEFHRKWLGLAAKGATESRLVGLAFDYCSGMVFSIANRITGSRWEAEDITQSVFENLARKLATVRDPARIPGFLKTCAVRVSLKHVKRSRWRREQVQLVFGHDSGLTRSDDAAMAASVRQLLDRLKPDERTAVILKYVEMHSHDEVAQLMGVSVATARRRLDSGKKKIAALVWDGVVSEILEQMRSQP